MSQASADPQTNFNPARYDLLLRACFLPDTRAIAAFEQWNTYNDWAEHFNSDEYRLFPQLHRNLAALGFDHPLLAKFKGVARKSWYNNNLFFHRVATPFQAMRNGNIPVLVLSGGTLALRYYNDHMLMHSFGFGILVPPQHARAAFNHLVAAGWTPQPHLPSTNPNAYFNTRYFTYFQNPNGDHLSLQWQFLPACPSDATDASIWNRAQEITLDGSPALALDPTDQLALTCALGSLPLGAPRAQRSADALLLLNTAGEQIAWDRFLASIQNNHVILPAREILLPLAATFNTLIPASTLEKLAALPVPADEQKNRTLWDAVTPTERRQQLARLFALRTCNTSALNFPTFLQHWWGLTSLAQVPRYALSALRRNSSKT